MCQIIELFDRIGNIFFWYVKIQPLIISALFDYYFIPLQDKLLTINLRSYIKNKISVRLETTWRNHSQLKNENNIKSALQCQLLKKNTIPSFAWSVLPISSSSSNTWSFAPKYQSLNIYVFARPNFAAYFIILSMFAKCQILLGKLDCNIPLKNEINKKNVQMTNIHLLSSLVLPKFWPGHIRIWPN